MEKNREKRMLVLGCDCVGEEKSDVENSKRGGDVVPLSNYGFGVSFGCLSALSSLLASLPFLDVIPDATDYDWLLVASNNNPQFSLLLQDTDPNSSFEIPNGVMVVVRFSCIRHMSRYVSPLGSNMHGDLRRSLQSTP